MIVREGRSKVDPAAGVQKDYVFITERSVGEKTNQSSLCSAVAIEYLAS
jgi:hypothetical protein